MFRKYSNPDKVLFILIIGFLIYGFIQSVSLQPTKVQADTAQQCLKYDDGTLAKIQSEEGGGCEYLVSSYLQKGWHIVQFTPIPDNGYGACGCD
jgi:hypothetical protein